MAPVAMALRVTLLAGLFYLANATRNSSTSSTDARNRSSEVIGPAHARQPWPIDGVKLHSTPKQKKLVVFYNGWRLLDNCDPSNWGRTCTLNHGKCREMVGLGFNVAVVMSYTPASALRA